ncbi:MAG: hypothetical protein M1837_003825 [Sclerophora amabilis]|nr:MAG: hypothetical protein M1837_003825 [Sclerophora amabilis]
MSLTTQVLVDGVWTTRTMDLNTILESHREDGAPKSLIEDTMDLPPTAGILTKTIIPTPVVNWIIPARIRHKYKNDVVFVGETFVQIRELRGDGHLHDIVKKCDFGAKIQHARIFGIPRKPAMPGLDASIARDLPPAGYAYNDAIPDPQDVPIFDQPKLPPHILVLTLDSSTLVFLFAQEGTDGSVNFITSSRSLPRRVSELQYPGKQIAVDPKSRAMAVSAQENSFIIYSLVPMSQLKREVKSGGFSVANGFNPVREERQVDVEGIILRLDFLHPEPSDEARVILLLAVSKDHKTWLLTFEWDSLLPLRIAQKQQGRGYLLPDCDNLPLLLIPLTFLSAFVLVFPSKLRALTYTSVVTGTTDKNSVITIERSHFAHMNALQPPLWTSWSRPLRSKVHMDQKDDIYLCSDDGLVQLVSLDRGSDLVFDLSCPAATLHGNVSTAFASLDLGVNKCDMVVTGGDMSVGGLYLIRPKKNNTDCIEAVPNWSPILDFIVSDASTTGQVRDFKSGRSEEVIARRDRIFAGTGMGMNGSITEFRYGLEARVGAITQYRSGVDAIWTFPDLETGAVCLLCSIVTQTELLTLSVDLQSVEMKQSDDVPGLDLEARTLSSFTFERFVVQVTLRSINVCSLDDLSTRVNVVGLSSICKPEEIIIQTAFYPATSCLITSIQGACGAELRSSFLSTDERNIIFANTSRSISLQSDTTCLSVFDVKGTPCVVVGTEDCALRVFRCEAQNGLVLLHDLSFRTALSPNAEAVCDSVTLFPNVVDTESPITSSSRLVCGLRNGHISFFDVSLSSVPDYDFRVTFVGTVKVGEAPVSITPDTANPDFAFITCGSDLCRLGRGTQSQLASVESIWLTDHKEPSFQQKSTSALTRIDLNGSNPGSPLDGCFVCISGDQLIIADIDEMSKTIPRHVAVSGSPKRIMYSKYADIIVVAYTELKTEIKQSSPSSSGKAKRRLKRTLFSSLAFLNYESCVVQSGAVEANHSKSKESNRRAMLGKPGERIYELIDWICTDGEKVYHFIVVGTGIIPQKDYVTSREGGRVILLRAVKSNKREVEARQKYSINFTNPVYAIAGYAPSSLVIATGNEICIRRLNIKEKRFEQVAAHHLASPCVYMTVSEPFIYVSTASDSMNVFKYLNDGPLKFHSGDISRRAGQCNLPIPGSQMVLASDKENAVTGHYYSPNNGYSKSLDVVFEAELPVAVMKLRFGATRPPWWHYTRPPGILESAQHPAKDQIIFGVGIDGTLFQFTILAENGWRLLRFMQNLAARSPPVCPLNNPPTMHEHLEPLSYRPTFMHVDGDILAKLLAVGPEELHRLLDSAPVRTSRDMRELDFDSSRARRRRFNRLVADVLGEDLEDPVASALSYVEVLLQPVL